MEDRYENLSDIETAINTKPIKEVVKHIDFTECLDKITLESPWTKKNFENNYIIDSELLISDIAFKEHFFRVNDIIEKEEDILFYICTWYKGMKDKERYYSCSGDLIKQRFYDEQVGEVIRKTFIAIYLEGIKKVGVVKLNKIIEKYLGYPLPNFCLKPEPWELLNTKQDPTTEIVKQKRLLINSINNFLIKSFGDIMKFLSREYTDKNITIGEILEESKDTNYEYIWKVSLRSFVYFVALINGKESTKIGSFLKEPQDRINWLIFLNSIEVRDETRKVINNGGRCSQKYKKATFPNFDNFDETLLSGLSEEDKICYRIYKLVCEHYTQQPK
jgi:hypothetical protein